jgi:hypothetical protein
MSDLLRLKQLMAAAHPDRGGTSAAFIKAHRRWVRAKQQAKIQGNAEGVVAAFVVKALKHRRRLERSQLDALARMKCGCPDSQTWTMAQWQRAARIWRRLRLADSSLRAGNSFEIRLDAIACGLKPMRA